MNVTSNPRGNEFPRYGYKVRQQADSPPRLISVPFDYTSFRSGPRLRLRSAKNTERSLS